MKRFAVFVLLVFVLNSLVAWGAQYVLDRHLLSEYGTGWLAGFLCVVIAEMSKSIVAKKVDP